MVQTRMNVTQNPITPTLKQGHAHVLCVGEPEGSSARPGGAVRVDEFGTWSLHETALEALERGLQLLRDEPGRRVVLDLGDCLCVSERRWTGPALRRLERVSARVPRGALAMTETFREFVTEHIEEAEDLEPLRTPDMTGEATELMVFQAAREEAVFARSNLSFERLVVRGRAPALERLTALEGSGQRVLEITGVAGVGKSALAYRYACVQAVGDASRERWWLDVEGVERIAGLAHALATLFGVRLGTERGEWSGQLAAMMSHRPLPCTMHLDGLDQLDADAVAWLDALVDVSEGTRWVLAHREAWGMGGAATFEVEALEEEDALALLMTDSEGVRGVQELERARALWRGCAGRPLALLHAKRHAHGLGTATAEELSAPRRAERDWAAIEERSRALLSTLLEIEGGAEVALLELMFEGELEPDAIVASLARLRTIGWAHLDPTRDTDTWRTSEVFAGFVRANLSEGERARAEERFAEGIMRFAEQKLADLRGPNERAALATLRRHEQDVLRATEWMFARDRTRSVELVSSLRTYVRIAFSTFEIKPLVRRMLAQVDAASASAAELEVTLALTSSYDTRTSTASGELLDRCIERAGELGASTLFELYFQRTIELEDTFTTGEELERAVELLELAQVSAAGDEAKRAACEEMRARLEAQRGDMDAALEHAMLARDLAMDSGSDSMLGLCLFTLHRQHVARGQLQQAERTCALALRAMERSGHVTGEVMVLASSGYLDGMLGRSRRGKARLHRALRHSKANSYTFGVMNCEYLLGLMYLTTQSWEDAIAHLRHARRMHVEFGFDSNRHQCEVALGIGLAARGEVDQARAFNEDASAFFADQPAGSIHYMMELAARAPEVWEAGWVDHDAGRLDALERELEALPAPDDAPRGLDLGIMLGLIASARSENASASAPAPEQALRVARDASSFTLPGADGPVDMSRRRTVRRVLEALLTERLERPGDVLDAHALMARGWPGESTEVRNGLMKLYVTVNTLRRLGLEDILQTYGEGYRLDPDVPIALETEGS